MKYKSDKYPGSLDEDVLRYTSRRIRELRGEVIIYDDESSSGMHPYIRRRLDELKQKRKKENS
jgi:hypothetical protein|tara:strand:+ start:8591 stop:8779 length:189 start_codon:yes stop_codon:yes gene_type:complete